MLFSKENDSRTCCDSTRSGFDAFSLPRSASVFCTDESRSNERMHDGTSVSFVAGITISPVYMSIVYWLGVAEPMHPLDVGFDWDEANAQKNWERHRVTPEEAEEVFFNEPLVVRSDIRHSQREKRYYALRQTSLDRYLFIAFTIRGKLIRVVSVREMNRREQEFYGKH